ncbi:hypothetical protein DPMN_159618 [Dreissena polymorpha]|uniref:Uncharacterized protein n=1 Tax=Dreissena polymorpha TaxID=45954 RepID=A0A9D4IPC0_DREPO|nr:hypothetical protein DPMN_159618 [Dreissena polymorpha]
MLKLAQTNQQANQPTNQPTDQPTDRAKTIYQTLAQHFAHLRGFHDPRPKNVTSTVFTCFHNIHIAKNAPPTGGHVFSPIRTIFKLVPDINKTNVLTNFHDDWAKIVSSRVFTRENCHYIHIEKNAPPTGGHVFSPISTIFELVRDIN